MESRRALAAAREARQLTQEAATVLCGLPTRTLQALEAGTATPTPYILSAISARLGVHLRLE